MILTPMTEAEFNVWAPRSRQGYAEDKMKANGYTREEAENIASGDFARLLPEGYRSEGNHLFVAKDDQGEILGFAWFRLQGARGNEKAFIYDVIIEERFRGKGYGKQMMLLLETEVRRMGIHCIGLHVFAFNEPAVRLYQSLGYLTTDLVMEKTFGS